MNWIRERDALIAQTLAFVQSVTGRKEDFRQPDTVAPAPALRGEIVQAQTVTVEIEPVQAVPAPKPSVTPPSATPPPAISPPAISPPRLGVDVRTEMQARIASFRKHQERFEREREEYCAATLTKLRAAIRDAPPRPPADN